MGAGLVVMVCVQEVNRLCLSVCIHVYAHMCICVHLCVYMCISSKNTFGVKKAQPSKIESYLEVNT